MSKKYKEKFPDYDYSDNGELFEYNKLKNKYLKEKK